MRFYSPKAAGGGTAAEGSTSSSNMEQEVEEEEEAPQPLHFGQETCCSHAPLRATPSGSGSGSSKQFN
ncbi:hypothetical protein AWZ03_013738 [Drosophila navojoa]|uniref:Uncharacterized protein n=1 Tax=Drosophila navojoa TaxID=7232 RepID=A0A484AUX3_DRONA|nr:hypothetical protein AWZ03_013738 [Drosophila navojoa]